MANHHTIEMVKRKYENLRYSFWAFLAFSLLGNLLSKLGLSAIGIFFLFLSFMIFWGIVKRQKTHFADINELASKALIKAQELGVDTTKLKETLLKLKGISPVNPILFWVYFILLILGSILGVLAVFQENESLSVVGVVTLIISLLIWLYILHALNSRFHLHEKREKDFFGWLIESLKKDEMKEKLEYLEKENIPKRSTFLYLILTILTIGFFGIYWIWTLFNDPHKHFDSHIKWEPEIIEFVEGIEIEKSSPEEPPKFLRV